MQLSVSLSVGHFQSFFQEDLLLLHILAQQQAYGGIESTLPIAATTKHTCF